MRIYETSGQFGDDKTRLGKSQKKSGKHEAAHVSRERVNESSFLKHLDSAVEDQVTKSLDALIEELSEQGKLLLKHRTFGELEKYKKLVRNFMDAAVKKIYSVKVSDSSKIMEKRKKVHIIVGRVDAELERLTKQILEKEAASMDILSTLDKIRGILVDMYS